MRKSYFTKDQYIQFDRDRLNYTIDDSIMAGFTINNFINDNNFIDYYKVNVGTLDTITILDNNYIQFEFRGLYRDKEGIVGTGYYWSQRLIKDDDRIGKRKLYKSSKGLYFIESGYRYYLHEFNAINR